MIKKRHYDQRVREVEHGTFSPLVFSSTGGMGRIATTTYKGLASLIAAKNDEPYVSVLLWAISDAVSFSPSFDPQSCASGELDLQLAMFQSNLKPPST